MKGRPTKYNETQARKIVEALKTGATIAEASRACGIVPETVRAWILRKPDFATECRKAQNEKKILALQAELRAIEAGNMQVIKNYLDREERRRHSRAMEKIRREEIRLRGNGSGNPDIIPAILDMNAIVDGINGL